jgi:hypothetical protein
MLLLHYTSVYITDARIRDNTFICESEDMRFIARSLLASIILYIMGPSGRPASSWHPQPNKAGLGERSSRDLEIFVNLRVQLPFMMEYSGNDNNADSKKKAC